jgi:hypothetical protein
LGLPLLKFSTSHIIYELFHKKYSYII